jgi:MSHA biogenesis protein MshE
MYSLPRISQIALQGVPVQHQEIIWQQALSMSFDTIALDSVNDNWLQPLARLSDSVSTVINTICADRAVQVMHRLKGLKLSNYRFVESATAVLMQYPVRLHCEHCKAPKKPTPEQQAWLDTWLKPDNSIQSWIGTNSDNFMMAEGCEHCHHTGLSGWTTVYEWLEFNPEIRAAINDGHWQTATSFIQLQQTAVQSVFKLARQGSISLAEAKRVLDPISHQS